MRRLLLASSLWALTFTAAAQQPDWNMDGAQEINTSITTLPVADQQGIHRALAKRSANPHDVPASSELRATQIRTPSGHLFLVQALGNNFCGASGNCSFWVLSSDYNILLDTIAQMFKVQKSQHSVHPDIVTSMHDSASSGDLRQWRFTGPRYKPVACATYNYTNASGDTLTTPTLTPHPCS